MKQNGAGRLALESACTLIKAMVQLEVPNFEPIHCRARSSVIKMCAPSPPLTRIVALCFFQVGEIGVMKFGESTQLVHHFNTAFSEENGAYLVSSFKFNQQRTRWPNVPCFNLF